jgi:small subunit ribosomal protein S20
MATHKSAIKRNRQNIVRRARNSQARAAIRTSVKKTRSAIKANDKGAKDLMKLSQKELAKAAGKGLMNKKTAARLTSRLAKQLKASAK